MLKTIPKLLLCILPSASVFAQNSGTLWSSQIVDKETHLPISFVHVIGAHEQVISDSKGVFSIQIQVGDTIRFSHINFERYGILVSGTSSIPTHIYLTKKENLLQEIIIHDYLPEEEFKQEIVEHEIGHTVEEVNAINNVAYSTMLYKKGYVPQMNSLDNFKNYIKEPQGVALLSSNPSKGLIKSFKKLKPADGSLSQSKMKLNRIKIDSLLVNHFLIPNK